MLSPMINHVGNAWVLNPLSLVAAAYSIAAESTQGDLVASAIPDVQSQIMRLDPIDGEPMTCQLVTIDPISTRRRCSGRFA